MRDEAIERGLIRARDADGRHHARSNFADDLFPDFGASWNVSQRYAIEREARGLEPLVVTRDAVLLQQRAVIGSGCAMVCGRDRCRSLTSRRCRGLTGSRRRQGMVRRAQEHGDPRGKTNEDASSHWRHFPLYFSGVGAKIISVRAGRREHPASK